MNYLLFIIPILNAVFAWWLVDTLLKFVFRPYDPVKIFGFTVQGILPAMQKEIGKKISDWAEHNIPVDKMQSMLLSAESLKEFHDYMEIKADDFIRNKLTERISLLKMFITESIIIQAKEVLVAQLDEMIPELIKKFVPKISEKINVKSNIEKWISLYPLQHLEIELKKQIGIKLLRLKFAAALAGLLLGFAEILLIMI